VKRIEAFAGRLVEQLGLDRRRVESTRAASVGADPFVSAALCAVFGSLATPNAFAANIRLLHGAHEIPRDIWSASRVSHGQVVHTELLAPFVDESLRNGDLLVIDSLDECEATMMALREALEYRLSAYVWINVYLTATSTSSFGPHRDDMDTLIVQLLGRKRWTVAAGPGDRRFPADAMTLELRPGSVLAVPANTFHDVTGLGELALHLTIGFDQAAGVVHRLKVLDELVGRHSAELTAAELDVGKAMLPGRRVGSSLPFRATRDPQHCGHIRWASQLPPVVRTTDDGGVEVISMGHQARFESKLNSVVRALATGKEFDLDALGAASGLDREALMNFVIEAVDAGLIICRI
jgi:hypothetical protein